MRRDQDYVRDILDAANLAIEHLGEATEESFLSRPLIQAAVLYRITVMGEAVNRISEEAQARFPSVPWHVMRGMRNVLIHEYDQVRLDIVYATVRRNLPGLVVELQRILTESWPTDEASP